MKTRVTLPFIYFVFSTIFVSQAKTIIDDGNLTQHYFSPQNSPRGRRENLCQNSYLYGGGLNSVTRNPSIEDRIADYFDRLKSFVHNTVFEATEFLLLENLLEENLLILQDLISEEALWSDNSFQVQNADRMFHDMVLSASLMKYFNPILGMPQRMIYKLLEINVKFLTLFDSYGLPAKPREKYREQINRFTIVFTSWYSIFMSLEDVPKILLLLFTINYTKSELSLQLLEGLVMD